MTPESEGNSWEATPTSCFGKQMEIPGDTVYIDQVRNAFLIELSNQGLPRRGSSKVEVGYY